MSSIRGQYERFGVRAYYAAHGREYANPHEPVVRRAVAESVRRWGLDLGSVLDLACGSGEATLPLIELGSQVTGIDPYTGDAYRRRTGRPAEGLSFEQIAAGALRGRGYSLIVCSYAMHLVEESRLPALAYELSGVGRALLLLTPHKRPVLREEWGWRLGGEEVFTSGEPDHVRVRARLYTSLAQHGV